MTLFPISVLVAAAAFWLTHGLWIHAVPGLHYDEAWAANFAARIADGNGAFLPFEAQSPYTAAWGHYGAALAFKLFGVSLAVYRISQILWVWLGSLLIAGAIGIRSGRRASVAFLWLMASSLALVLNHRFAIDVNTFHVFCLGLMALGLALWELMPALSCLLLGAGAWLGITSHLAFLAPVLGLYAASFFRGPWGRRVQWTVTALALLLLPRMIQIHQAIPEKDKVAVLIAGICAAAVLAWLQPRLVRLASFARFRSVAGPVAAVGFALLLAIFVFFWEGHWTSRFFMGSIHLKALVGGNVLLLLILLAARLHERGSLYRGSRTERDARDWFLGTLAFAAIVMVKPAGRYFETSFVLFTAMLALTLSTISIERARLWLVCFVLLGGLAIEENYLRPGREYRQTDTDVRAWIFHDSTSDTLPKQEVAEFLAENGCPRSVVQAQDPRLAESLDFLAKGDWELASQPCSWSSVSLAREREAGKLDWIISRMGGLVLAR